MDSSSPPLSAGRRKARELSALEVRRLVEPGLHFVGGVDGLILRVLPSGSRQWVLRARIGGKRTDIGLGGFPDVTLEGARSAARTMREQIRAGVDPVASRRKAREALAAERAKAIPFKQAAEAYMEMMQSSWRSPQHAMQWAATLETYAYPVIGRLSVSAICDEHIMKILDPIWREKTETASRVRGRIEVVLDWATVRKYRTGENPARWRGHLDKLLPKPSKVKPAAHFAALPWREISAFMTELRAQDGTGARALEFAILTGARSGEVRGALWSEVDTTPGVEMWVIPGARTKNGKEHRVPLSADAVRLLEALPRVKGEAIIFPGMKAGMPLSSMTMTATLRRMGSGDLTVHGFRSTFRDWAAEATSYPHEVCEMALGHTVGDKVEAAYRRGDLFEKRRRLAADWAKFCNTPAPGGDVVPLRKTVA